MKKKIKKIILFAMILLLMNSVSASICTVIGYVNLEDGSPAPKGIKITVSNTNKSISYDTYTGGKDWPIENFYVQTLSCDFYDEIVIENKATEFKKSIIFDHYPYEINITLPYAVVEKLQKEPSIEKPILIKQEDRYMHDVMMPKKQEESFNWFSWFSLFLAGISVILIVFISYRLIHKDKI